MLTLGREEMRAIGNAAYKSLLMGTSVTTVVRANGYFMYGFPIGGLMPNITQALNTSAYILAGSGLLSVAHSYTPLPEKISFM